MVQDPFTSTPSRLVRREDTTDCKYPSACVPSAVHCSRVFFRPHRPERTESGVRGVFSPGYRRGVRGTDPLPSPFTDGLSRDPVPHTVGRRVTRRRVCSLETLDFVILGLGVGTERSGGSGTGLGRTIRLRTSRVSSPTLHPLSPFTVRTTPDKNGG